MSKQAILGVPVAIKSTHLRATIRRVLLQIQHRHPKDFIRLKAQVLAIIPLSETEPTDGTLAQWLPSRPDPADFPQGMVPLELDTSPSGRVAVPEGLEKDKQVATLAHELGHACATWDDQQRRNAPSDEWASELTADWYAYRWGFGRDIRRSRKTRAWVHHAVGPGQIIEECIDGTWYKYRVTRNLCMRLVKTYQDKPQAANRSSRQT